MPAGEHGRDIQKQELGTSDLVVHGGKWKAGRHFPSRSAQTEGKMLAQPPAQERRGHTGSSPQPEGPNRPRGDLLGLARNPGIPGSRSICKCLATKREEPCSARGVLVLLRTGGLGKVNVGCRELGCYEDCANTGFGDQQGGG